MEANVYLPSDVGYYFNKIRVRVEDHRYADAFAELFQGCVVLGHDECTLKEIIREMF